ncbi:MAG: alkaline phosphatase family protein [Promethearchaeota archaeon]
MAEKKVFVIGIDGGTFEIIKPCLHKLPNFSKILNEGANGFLKSTIPPLSPAAWTSIITGTNPGKHGIFGFFSESSEDYRLKLSYVKKRKSKAIWHILNEHGKKTVVVNFPFAYPPEKVNGLIISGLGAPGIESRFTYPSSLKQELLANVPDYRIDVNVEEFYLDATAFVNEIYHLTEARKRAALYLMEKKDWDFFMVVFVGADRLQHFLWNTHLRIKTSKGIQKYNVIVQYYQLIDAIIGDFLQKLDENTITLIVSDHGFKQVKRDIYINNWLKDKGLLDLKSQGSLSAWLIRRGITTESSNAALMRHAHSKWYKILHKLIPKRLISFFALNLSNIRNYCNWRKTKAFSYSLTAQSIRINLKGREKNGVVNPEEYDVLRDFIASEISKLTDPETGKKIVSKVYKREKIYIGPYTENAPDLLFQLNDGYAMFGGFGNDVFSAKKDEAKNSKNGSEGHIWKAAHDINGIFMAFGKDIHPVQLEANVLDIAPTILHIMNISIPSMMDGEILRKIFDTTSDIYNREEKIHQIDRNKEKINEEREMLTEEEELEIMERLKGLGYM